MEIRREINAKTKHHSKCSSFIGQSSLERSPCILGETLAPGRVLDSDQERICWSGQTSAGKEGIH